MIFHNWEKVCIKDIGRVITGRTPPTETSSYFGNDYPFITPTDMRGEKNIYKAERGLSSQGARLLTNNRVLPKSIAVSCIGWQMGKVAMISKTAYTNQQINTIVPTNKNADPDFVYYSLCTRRKELQNLGSVGTRTPILKKSGFENIEIYLPPLPIQRTIASILSAYDDLIENNARRIAILEEMAQMVYQEWFVKFRFPGHERVKMVESGVGMVPEGWEVMQLRDVTHMINRGISPNYDVTSNSLVINQKCIRDSKLNLGEARRHLTKFSDQKLIQFGDVLINSTGTGTLGRVTQVYQNIPDCTVDSHVTIVRSNSRVNIDFFGLQLLQRQSYFESLAVGSTGQTELGRESIAKTAFLLPPENLQNRFAAIVSPMRNYSIQMIARNANLRRTRDMLLPKLIAGEIGVSSWVKEGGEEDARELASVVGREMWPAEPIERGGLEQASLWE